MLHLLQTFPNLGAESLLPSSPILPPALTGRRPRQPQGAELGRILPPEKRGSQRAALIAEPWVASPPPRGRKCSPLLQDAVELSWKGILSPGAERGSAGLAGQVLCCAGSGSGELWHFICLAITLQRAEWSLCSAFPSVISFGKGFRQPSWQGEIPAAMAMLLPLPLSGQILGAQCFS